MTTYLHSVDIGHCDRMKLYCKMFSLLLVQIMIVAVTSRHVTLNSTIVKVTKFPRYKSACLEFKSPLISHGETVLSHQVYLMDLNTKERIKINTLCDFNTTMCVNVGSISLKKDIHVVIPKITVLHQIERIDKYFYSRIEDDAFAYSDPKTSPFSCGESCEVAALGTCGSTVIVTREVRFKNSAVTCLELELSKGLAKGTIMDEPLCEMKKTYLSEDMYITTICTSEDVQRNGISITFANKHKLKKALDFSRSRYLKLGSLPYGNSSTCELYNETCHHACQNPCESFVDNPWKIHCDGRTRYINGDTLSFYKSFPLEVAFSPVVHFPGRHIMCFSVEGIEPRYPLGSTPFWNDARVMKPHSFSLEVECENNTVVSFPVTDGICNSTYEVGKAVFCAKVLCFIPVRVIGIKGPVTFEFDKIGSDDKVIFTASGNISFPFKGNLTTNIPVCAECIDCVDTCENLLLGNVCQKEPLDDTHADLFRSMKGNISTILHNSGNHVSYEWSLFFVELFFITIVMLDFRRQINE